MADPQKPSDEELMAVVANDATTDADRALAWSTLTTRHHRRLKQCLRKRGVADQDAEDLIQQVWVDIHKRVKEFDAERSLFRTWLGRLVRSRMVDQFRVLKRRSGPLVSVEVEGLPDSARQPLAAALNRDVLRCIWESITGGGSERDAEILWLRYAGYTFLEIAKLLGITNTAARQTASRSIKLVRRCLAAKGMLEA